MSVDAWRSDNSQIHARRQACLAGRVDLPDRLAALMIDTEENVRQLNVAFAGQSIELVAALDGAHGLLQVGRTCPDVVVIGPVAGRLAPEVFVEVLRVAEPDLPLVVGVGDADSGLAARAAVLGATVLAHPFRPEQLVRLLATVAPTRRPIEVRPLTIDLGRLRINGAAPQMWLDDRLVGLPMREYLLLRYFAERVGTVLTRQEILRALWGSEDAGERGKNTLNVHVTRLRRRLGDDAAEPRWIRSIRGLGYQFTIPSPSTGSADT